MNKFSLRFLSNETELRFQQHYNIQTLYPLSFVIYAGGVINSLIQIITRVIINKDQWELVPWIGACLFFMITQLATMRYKFYTQKLITLTILIMNICIFYNLPTLDEQNLFQAAFNLQTINTLTILISDFQHSVFLLVSILSIWTTYVGVNYKVDYSSLPLTFLGVIIVTMVVSYWNCRLFRQKYLLGEKENLWVSLIQQVCDNPFQILTFDDINLKYKIENQKNFENQDFIKQTQFDSQPLQKYIYQTQTNLAPTNGLLKDEIIFVTLKKQTYKIRLTYYYIQKIFIIVQILQDENKIEFLKLKNQKIDRRVQEMIQQIVKMLPTAAKSTKNLLKLKLALIEVYFRRFKVEIKEFNLNKLIYKHIKPFNKYRQQILFEYERNITINGYQSLYSLIFIRILYSKSKIDLVRLVEDDQGYHIIFYGDIRLIQDNIIQNCLQIMQIKMEIQQRWIKMTQIDIEFNDQDDCIQENHSILFDH